MTRKKPDSSSPADLLNADAAAMLMPNVSIQPEYSRSPAGSRRLRARMWQTIQRSLRTEHNNYVTVHCDEGEWVPLFPLVEMKVLRAVGEGASFLLRLQPGAHLPAHDHLDVEECLMMKGDLDLGGGTILRAGDYHMAPRGLSHGTAVSRNGALVFIRSDLPAYRF